MEVIYEDEDEEKPCIWRLDDNCLASPDNENFCASCPTYSKEPEFEEDDEEEELPEIAIKILTAYKELRKRNTMVRCSLSIERKKNKILEQRVEHLIDAIRRLEKICV